MKNVLLLVGHSDRLTDGNYLRICNTLLERQVSVWIALTDSLMLVENKVQARALEVKQSLIPGEPFPSVTKTDPLSVDAFDLCWLLNLGLRHSFLDKMQLLEATKTKVINSVDSITHFKSKYFLASLGEHFPYPPSWASADMHFLERVMRDQGGSWIVKPPAGSFGRDVIRLEGTDENLLDELLRLGSSEGNQYVLLQRYVDSAEKGEKRILLAGGSIVGQYHRLNPLDYRANVSLGSTTSLCTLTEEEKQWCQLLGDRLLEEGIYFTGIDLAWPWLIEINVVNPGGIVTIDDLGGGNLMPTAVDSILAKLW